MTTLAPVVLYELGLAGDAPGLRVRFSCGDHQQLALDRWLGAADRVDTAVLAGAGGPVLDVGCGPGRHLQACAALGLEAVGIDIAPVAISAARRRGCTVIRASVFDPLPRSGHWRTALLFDGNIGIGGRPDVLLQRIAELLAPGGRALVELDPPGSGSGPGRARLESGEHRSHWFPWARVASDDAARLAAVAGMTARPAFELEGRWFARLDVAPA